MPTLADRDRDRIAALFDRHLDVGLHHGAQLSVSVDGNCVLDLAGGVTGPEGDRTTPETRHVLFSCTKPYAAVALHSLVEDGALGYDDRRSPPVLPRGSRDRGIPCGPYRLFVCRR